MFPMLVSPLIPAPQISVDLLLTPKQRKAPGRDACLCRTQLQLISLPAFPKELVSFHHSTCHEPVIPKRSQLHNCADTSNSPGFSPELCVFAQCHTPFSGQVSELWQPVVPGQLCPPPAFLHASPGGCLHPHRFPSCGTSFILTWSLKHQLSIK